MAQKSSMLTHIAGSLSHSFVEEPPRTPQESHHLVLQPIHGFEARSDAGGLRDGKETKVIVACKQDIRFSFGNPYLNRQYFPPEGSTSR